MKKATVFLLLVCLAALMLLSLTGLGALGRRNGRKKHQN